VRNTARLHDAGTRVGRCEHITLWATPVWFDALSGLAPCRPLYRPAAPPVATPTSHTGAFPRWLLQAVLARSYGPKR
jgi:hypothetical protein